MPADKPDFPSRRLAASVGKSWLAFTSLQSSGAACAFTVAGQWRTFTALPEHSVAGKSYQVRNRQNQGQPQEGVSLKLKESLR
jgi:hypothetical protein